jgi:LacI family transcriptional regulator
MTNKSRSLKKNFPVRSVPIVHRSEGRNILLALEWYYPEMHRGVARFARNHNWHLTADLDDPIPRHWRGDGVVTHLGARMKIWNQMRKLRVPVVDLTESQPHIHVPRLTMDNAAIGRMAAEYFLNRGYRRLAFFHRWDLGVSRRRGEHFRAAVKQAGGTCYTACWQKECGKRPDSREQRHRWMIKRLREMPNSRSPTNCHPGRGQHGDDLRLPAGPSFQH